MIMTDQPPFDVAVIKEILPHRSPFLFVDRVLKINCGENIVAEKDLSPDEWFFSGHFPGKPIVPGVIVSEALAQTSGLLLGLTFKTQGREQADLSLANLTIKFVTPAKPKETIRLAATLKKTYGKMYLFEVAADVLNRRIAKGTLILASD
jgi:3-hydroxyacyl-[acyl-carrier-protein] dehydratase